MIPHGGYRSVKETAAEEVWAHAERLLVGALSDTHLPRRGPLPAQLLAGFASCDLILHAGDLKEVSVLETLAEVAPVVAVAGNNDPPAVWARLGRVRLLELAGTRVGLIHGDGQGKGGSLERSARALPTAEVVVFGHSHRPQITWQGGRMFLNPGSPTDPRREPYPTYGLLHLVRGEAPRGEILRLPRRGTEASYVHRGEAIAWSTGGPIGISGHPVPSS